MSQALLSGESLGPLNPCFTFSPSLQCSHRYLWFSTLLHYICLHFLPSFLVTINLPCLEPHVFFSRHITISFHFSTSYPSPLSSPPLPPSQKSLLSSHSHLTSPLMISLCPPLLLVAPSSLLTPGCVPCLHLAHHHPHHLPRSPCGAVFVCVGCTVLHKSRMLMRQKAAEHYVEWTNFRSAWLRFITAHKPKVSCVRWRGKSVPCSTWIIYHCAPVCSLSCFLSCSCTDHMQFSTTTVIYAFQFLSCHIPSMLSPHICLYLSFMFQLSSSPH